MTHIEQLQETLSEILDVKLSETLNIRPKEYQELYDKLYDKFETLISTLLEKERNRIAEEVKNKLKCIGNPQGFSESATWSKGAKEAYDEVLSIIKQGK